MPLHDLLSFALSQQAELSTLFKGWGIGELLSNGSWDLQVSAICEINEDSAGDVVRVTAVKEAAEGSKLVSGLDPEVGGIGPLQYWTGASIRCTAVAWLSVMQCTNIDCRYEHRNCCCISVYEQHMWFNTRLPLAATGICLCYSAARPTLLLRSSSNSTRMRDCLTRQVHAADAAAAALLLPLPRCCCCCCSAT